MKALPTQERALRKRSALIDAAIEEFVRSGFEVATAKSIAATAQVATGTFYQYFDNKNDILRVIASYRYEQLSQEIKSYEHDEPSKNNDSSDCLESTFLQTLKLVFDYHASNPELHQVLEHRRALDPSLCKIMDQGEKFLRSRVLSFVNRYTVSDAELLADNLFAMAEGLVHRLVFHSNKHDPMPALALGAKMLASYFTHLTINNEQA